MKKAIFLLLAVLGRISVSYATLVSATAPSGQMLYFEIYATYAEVRSPKSSGSWSGYNMPTGNLVIPSSVYYNGHSYPVTTIRGYAFTSCSNITTVSIPSSVTEIGADAFIGCSGITSVTLPNSVTNVESNAFAGCSGLQYPIYNNRLFARYPESYWLMNYAIPDGITTIVGGAFKNCEGLFSITIPASVRNIEEGFGTCTNFCSYEVDASNTRYASQNGVLFSRNMDTLVDYPTGKSGNYTVPNTVTTIGEYAFRECRDITSVTIPNSVNTLLKQAFYHCPSLKKVSLGAGVNSIPQNCFRTCPSLDTFICKNPQPPTLNNWSPFDASTDCIVIVPCETSEAYSQSSWRLYFNNFTEDCNIYHTIDAQPNNPAYGTVSGGGEYIEGETATLRAMAHDGYRFVMWLDGSTDNPRMIIVTESATYTALFSEYNPHIITVTSNNPDWGSVTGGGLYEEGETATLTATASPGYHFVMWLDGPTDNPRTVTVTGDATYTAVFAEGGNTPEGIDAVRRDESRLYIWPNPASDYVYVETRQAPSLLGTELQIIDLQGRVVRSYKNSESRNQNPEIGNLNSELWNLNSEHYTLDLGSLPAGSYFVKLGNAVQKLIIQ